MRVSSATASFDASKPLTRTDHALDASQTHAWPLIKRYFHKLDRFLTAIAHAEAGNLDAVREIINENRPRKYSPNHVARNGGMEWK